MRRQNSTVRILILVFAVLIAIVAIFDVAYYFIKKNQLKSITLQPEFTETSLEVGTQYTFKIVTEPGKASLKKATAVVDDPTSSFEIRDDQAILTTGMNEGNVTVYVECKDQKSQVLTFSVVDSVARAQAEAAAAAEEEKKAEEEAALAEAEAEAAAAQLKKYVKATGDNVNVRSTNSTDGDVLGKAKKGEMFEKVEDVDDWTHIMYNGQDGYMKTEFLTEISEEEYQQGPTEEDTKTEEKKEEKKEEEKKPENTEANAAGEESQTQTKEEAEAKAAADAAKKAEEDAKKAEEDLKAVQEQLAAAQAAQAATGYTICGVNVTPTQYKNLIDNWRYATTNGTDEEVKAFHEAHHTAGDIQTIITNYGW